MSLNAEKSIVANSANVATGSRLLVIGADFSGALRGAVLLLVRLLAMVVIFLVDGRPHCRGGSHPHCRARILKKTSIGSKELRCPDRK
jgi:hypothetical protein